MLPYQSEDLRSFKELYQELRQERDELKQFKENITWSVYVFLACAGFAMIYNIASSILF
jgi:hypothetical protein